MFPRDRVIASLKKYNLPFDEAATILAAAGPLEPPPEATIPRAFGNHGQLTRTSATVTGQIASSTATIWKTSPLPAQAAFGARA
jgi:hypothetical protein